MVFAITSMLTASVGTNAQHRHILLFIPGQRLVIKQICHCDGMFMVIELHKGNLAIGVGRGLLIDSATPFDVSYIADILLPS